MFIHEVEKPGFRRYKLRLALSGGCARGFAHLGAFKAFEDVYIPIKVFVTNLYGREHFVPDKRPLIQPISASCSIPIVFNPLVVNDVNYVDGGLFKDFTTINLDKKKIKIY